MRGYLPRDRWMRPLGSIRQYIIVVKPSMNLADKQFLEAIGQRIREQRKARGLTLVQLADKTELDRTFLGLLETGKKNISLLNLRRIAQKLRMRLSDIVGELK